MIDIAVGPLRDPNPQTSEDQLLCLEVPERWAGSPLLLHHRMHASRIP
jgi:hypothetical protein